MWNHGYGWGMDGGWGWGMWIVMLLGTIGFWLLVAYVVRIVIQGRHTDATRPAAGPTALQLLDERLARGEIDPEEYERTKRLLMSGR